jgi:hypothetical protein
MRTNVVIDDALKESALKTKKNASRLDSVNCVIEK